MTKKQTTRNDQFAAVGGVAVLPDRLLPDAVVVWRGNKITYVGKSRTKVPAAAQIVDAKGGLIYADAYLPDNEPFQRLRALPTLASGDKDDAGEGSDGQ